MPNPKATGAKAAVEAAETEEELAAALSALLKKGHAARTKALLKEDCELSKHILREAERAGLDANMLLAVYMGVIAHVLNPCTLATFYNPSIPPCTPPVLTSSMSRVCCRHGSLSPEQEAHARDIRAALAASAGRLRRGKVEGEPHTCQALLALPPC